MSPDRSQVTPPTDLIPAWRPPAGWRVIIPGLPHWCWGQHDQAIVFGGFHLAALAIGLFFWGTWLSLLMLGFAYAAHTFSAADAIEQAAFPKFGLLAPVAASALGLGLICYGPAMICGSMFAWPVVVDHRPREGYWANRWAYRGDASPQHGETIWLGPAGLNPPRLARVVAGEGQKVRWSENRLQVDGHPHVVSPIRTKGSTHDLELTVPDRHLLVSFHDNFVESLVDWSGWEIVAEEEVRGRAWALSYPVRERRFLW